MSYVESAILFLNSHLLSRRSKFNKSPTKGDKVISLTHLLGLTILLILIQFGRVDSHKEDGIKMLVTQMGQIAKQLANMNSTPFPANTFTNPKEQCNIITTRSGKEIGVGIGDNLN